MLASDRISKTSINSLNIFIFITVYLTCISSTKWPIFGILLKNQEIYQQEY